jgi:hypothetical protein
MILYHLNIQFFITLSIWQGGPHFILFFKNKKENSKASRESPCHKDKVVTSYIFKWWRIISQTGKIKLSG